VRRAIVKHSFCTLATSSGGAPHGAGVVYQAVDGVLYVSALEASKKARNIQGNPRVAVCIPVRRLPMAPPIVVGARGAGASPVTRVACVAGD
jgi:nitroimidazol reductase NimA-like FMN-containing flavoprotein (pyridoxamine 5'-phosphate oxidase superfamily)